MSSILLLNSSLQNKGDALMIRAVQMKFGPDHCWSVPANVYYLSRRQARGMAICLISDLPGLTAKQKAFNFLVQCGAEALGWLPATLRRRIGLLTPADIDVAFDMSGYCFGDFWKQERVDQCAHNYEVLRDGGAKVILMPKTWGPFARISSASLGGLFDKVDLAFARDQESLNNITSHLQHAHIEKLFPAPDYTHEVSPPAGSKQEFKQERIGWIIPNSHVVSSGTMERDQYLRLLAMARELFESVDMKPKLLIHETSNDLRFIGECRRMGFAESDVIVAEDAIDAKRLIAQGTAVVTSALHGAYNALNSLVPVAVVPAIPWQFKYAQALAHYDVPEGLVNMSDAENSLRSVFKLITDPASASNLRSRMQTSKQRQQAQTDMMWKRIYEVSGLRPYKPT